MNPKRLELEAIRDSMLFVSGQLDFERPAGIQVAGNGGKGNKARTRALLDEDAPYRTVYLPVLRDLLPEIYKTFDFPEPTQIKGQREVTTVPAQALFFLNSGLAVEHARRTPPRACSARPRSARTTRASAAPTACCSVASPRPRRLADARAFLARPRPDAVRWAAFVQALMAGTEFRYVW